MRLRGGNYWENILHKKYNIIKGGCVVQHEEFVFRIYVGKDKAGNYVPNFAGEVYKKYTNEQIATLITHVDGCDVIECSAERNNDGLYVVIIPEPK